MRTCKAEGCFTLTKGYSTYCNRHKRNLARHGHPHQTGINKRDLKPYLKEIRAFLLKQTASDPKAILEDIWNRTVNDARSFVREANQGQAHNRHEMQAQQAILLLADQQDAVKVAETLMAMGYWYEFDRRFWRFDDGFRFQTVRMLLRLNPKEAAYQWHDGKMLRNVYRDVPPGAIRFLWEIVRKTELVGYGIEIARRKAKAVEQRQRQREQERQALFGGNEKVPA